MKIDPLVEEYVRGLNQGQLETLYRYFNSGDRSSASDLISTDPKMDSWLGSSKSPDQFFDRIDAVRGTVVDRVEGRRR